MDYVSGTRFWGFVGPQSYQGALARSQYMDWYKYSRSRALIGFIIPFP